MDFVISNRTAAVLLDALGNQGVRRVRQVMSDETIRGDLVAAARRMMEAYPEGLCPSVVYLVLDIHGEMTGERGWK